MIYSNLIKRIFKPIILAIYNIAYAIIPINNKIIIFESSVGRSYTGNPKAIYEEIVNQKLDRVYKCIWILEDTNEEIIGRCKKIKRLRSQYFYYIIRAKFWIMDSREPIYLKKKKGNIYIQTWHGTPLKKLGLDMNFVNMSGDSNIKLYKSNFKKNSSRWDYLISQNSYSTEIFRRAFAFDKEILEIGYPRNDILINSKEDILKNLKESLKIPEGYKVILYAPTWRDKEYDINGNYKFTMQIDLKKFAENFSDKYILLIKPHYLIADNIDILGYDDNVRVCDIKQDIQELYIISDILITDYSSVMFDYSILKRPIIFFMYDLEKYQNEMREFYFNIIDEAPGQIVLNNEELTKAINYIDNGFDKYKRKYEEFCVKYNNKDIGNASKRIVKIIKESN